jgi:hypothetical protein
MPNKPTPKRGLHWAVKQPNGKIAVYDSTGHPLLLNIKRGSMALAEASTDFELHELTLTMYVNVAEDIDTMRNIIDTINQ